MFCHNCGTRNVENAAFCSRCGTQLNGAAGRNPGTPYAAQQPRPYAPPVSTSWYNSPMVEKEDDRHGVRVAGAVFAFIIGIAQTIDVLTYSGYVFSSNYSFNLFMKILFAVSIITFGVFLIVVKKPALFTIPFGMFTLYWGINLCTTLSPYGYYNDLHGAYYTIMTLAVLFLLISSIVNPMFKAWFAASIFMTFAEVLGFASLIGSSPESAVLDFFVRIPASIVMYFIAFYGIYRLCYPLKVKVPAPYPTTPNYRVGGYYQ